MAYDFKSLLKVPAAEAAPLLREIEGHEWERYGRNVHALINTERFITALTTSALRSKDQADFARRMRIFLTTGVIPT